MAAISCQMYVLSKNDYYLDDSGMINFERCCLLLLKFWCYVSIDFMNPHFMSTIMILGAMHMRSGELHVITGCVCNNANR